MGRPVTKSRQAEYEFRWMQMRERITELEAQLAECYRLSGADPDGNEDWRLAPHAVTEVRRMREEADRTDAENVALQVQVGQLGSALRRVFSTLQAIRVVPGLSKQFRIEEIQNEIDAALSSSPSPQWEAAMRVIEALRSPDAMLVLRASGGQGKPVLDALDDYWAALGTETRG